MRPFSFDNYSHFWPHQMYGLKATIDALESGKTKICLTSPTGGGKTSIVNGLIEWALSRGWYPVLYSNRKLLITQLARSLTAEGIEFGVRASGHEDQRQLQVQISSLPTENQRTIKTEQWDHHGIGHEDFAIVDELHLNCSGTARKMLARHKRFVGVTATPTDLGDIVDTLIVAGKNSELRACGALVPAIHHGVDEPDMSRFKPSTKTGEYREGDVIKAIMTRTIFARVLEHYKKLNPDQRPTLLFAPGVQESIWFAEEFHKQGIRAAHIDGEGIWVDGEYHRVEASARDSILEDVKAGSIKVLCNRFVLREGLDLPEVSHLILATVFASLRSYLQAVGRGLRSCPRIGKKELSIGDHGGHWHRPGLGSVNIDRDWHLGDRENQIKAVAEQRFREKADPEPIRCPKCSVIRMTGSKCPRCGYESSKKSRLVIQVDGTLREHVGDIYQPRKTKLTPTTEKLWKSTYFRAKNSKNGMTFAQARGLFFRDNGYWPPQDLPFMPTNPADWHRRVRDVPFSELFTASPTEERA